MKHYSSLVMRTTQSVSKIFLIVVMLFGFTSFALVAHAQSGLTELDPILPDNVTVNKYETVTFTFISPPPRRFFDPPFQSGWEYSLSSGFFLEVGLPTVLFPGIHDTPYGPVNLFIDHLFVSTLEPGNFFTFGPGVRIFSIEGIEPMIDLADLNVENAFPTFLDFTVPTNIEQRLSMRSLPVSEPTTLAIIGLGLLLMIGAVSDRRKGA